MLRRKRLGVILATALSMGVIPGEASPHRADELKNVALNFASLHKSTVAWKIAPPSKSLQSIDQNQNFKIIRLLPTGWIIVSTDDVARPILAYNLEENNTRQLPENFQKWITHQSARVEEAKKYVQKPSEEKREWSTLLVDHEKFLQDSEHFNKKTLQGNQNFPLLSTEWGQGTYYNALCPADEDGPDGHTMTGCVATAMAQIMRYFKWPRKGKSSHEYTIDPYGTLSVDFSTQRYHWSEMPNSLYDYNSEVAKIMYHAGVSVNMEYSPNGSGAYFSDANEAFQSHFRYHTEGLVDRSNYTEEAWHNLLKKELDAGRPIFYTGQGTGGHAFVCDGYDSADPAERKYHFNWGWDGAYDGYYALDALYPDDDNYNNDQEIIYGIYPIGNLPKPENLKIKKITETSAVLTWKQSSRKILGYKIYLNGQLEKKVSKKKERTKLKDLVPGTRYYVKIIAYNQKGESLPATGKFKTKGEKPSIIPITLNKSVAGKLTDKKSSTHRDGSYAVYYTFTLKEATSLIIDLQSEQFDTYLYVMDGKGESNPVLYEDDDGGTERNSSLSLTLEAGTYTIEVTSYDQEVTGKFVLSVKEIEK